MGMLNRWIRRVMFSDVSPLIAKGRQKFLGAEDFPELPNGLDPRLVLPGFLSLHWQRPGVFSNR